jgi:phenylpyruvate tautomerase PptA (4-oxalocrotonate tautomerase family)
MTPGQKISLAKMGHSVSEETKKKIAEGVSKYWKEHPPIVSEEQKRQISMTLMGHKIEEETKKKIATGVTRWHQEHPEWAIEHSHQVKGKCLGSDNPYWRGGVSLFPYPSEFKRYRRDIIKRDRVCQHPSCTGMVLKLSVHHIDYDKNNNTYWNLVTLCISYNSRVGNGSEVEKVFWQQWMDKHHPEYFLEELMA